MSSVFFLLAACLVFAAAFRFCLLAAHKRRWRHHRDTLALFGLTSAVLAVMCGASCVAQMLALVVVG